MNRHAGMGKRACLAFAVAWSSLGMSCGVITREFFPDDGMDAALPGDATKDEAASADAPVSDAGGKEDALCTVPEDCPSDRICERLSGACLRRSSVTCGVAPRTDLTDAAREAGEGEICTRAFGVTDMSCQQTPGCADPNVCVRASRFEDREFYCGWPAVKLGLCRPACDPCARGGCPPGESCMYVEGLGGACFPRSAAIGSCGQLACPPRESCILNKLRCELACESDGDCRSGTLCAGVYDGVYCMPAQRTVGVGETATPGVTVCDPRTSYSSIFQNTCVPNN